jgi:mRNA interferase RelE/StbE
MTYRLRFTPAVTKQIKKLDRVTATRIRNFLARLNLDAPRSVGKPLSGDSDLWRYRVGDYRILASISDEDVLILVVYIGHRREAYR